MTVLAQSNFDNIRICHDKQKQLRHVSVAQYDLDTKGGKLVSLSSKDGYIKYIEEERLFILKQPNTRDSFTIQISPAGIILTDADSSVTVTTLRAMKPFSDTLIDYSFIYKMRHAECGLHFNNNELSHINYNLPGSELLITVNALLGKYESGGFTIEKPPTDSVTFLMAYSDNMPFLIDIYDRNNNIGISLFSDKRTGLYSKLLGLLRFEVTKGGRKKTVFDHNKRYLLQYSGIGKLVKHGKGFNLDCVYD